MEYKKVLGNIQNGKIRMDEDIENECMPAVIEAIGKMIAKPVKKTQYDHGVAIGHCPFCGRRVYDKANDHCHRCGQKLIWEGENEKSEESKGN